MNSEVPGETSRDTLPDDPDATLVAKGATARKSHDHEAELLRALGLEKDYELVGLLARGGMGEVYKARHRKLGRAVVLKMVRSQLMEDERTQTRFELEGQMLARLEHPNVVQVFGFHRCEDLRCIEMAFVDGADLQQWIAASKPDHQQLAAVFAKIARACGYVHANGVIHRDLKPANVLMRAGTNEPVLVDFGIATGEESTGLTLTVEVVGTPAYMAPEQATARREDFSPATDVYAIGVMIYEALTGKRPNGDTRQEIFHRHETEAVPMRPSALRPDIPRDLEWICLKALNHRPHERYANGTELAEDLERFVAGDPVKARPLGIAVRCWRRVRKRPALAVAAVLAIAAVAVALWNHHTATITENASQLAQKINTDLSVKNWHETHLKRLEKDLEKLGELDAGRAATLGSTLRTVVPNALRLRISSPKLTDDELTSLDEFLQAWARRDPDGAGRLQAQLRERLTRWEQFVVLRPPFSSLMEAFVSTQTKIEKGVLRPLHGKQLPNIPRVVIKPRINRPVELEVVFSPPAKGTPRVGLTIGPPEGRYNFRLMSFRDLPQALQPHVEANAAAEGRLVLAVLQENRLLRAIRLPDEDLLQKEIRLRARVDHTRLECEVNNSLRLQAVDLFAHAFVGKPFELGVEWPIDTGITELRVNAQGMASKPSPLELADSHFRASRWSRAISEYQALMGHAEYGQEARYKTGLAQFASGAVDDAIAMLDPLASTGSTPWQELASLRLWQHHALSGDLTKANAWFARLPPTDKLPAGFVASISSQDRASILKAYQAAGRGMSSLKQDAANIELGVQIHQTLGVPPTEVAVKFGLALHFNGLDARALDLFREGMAARRQPEGKAIEKRTLLLCLDNWLWIPVPESDRMRRDAIASWRNDHKDAGTDMLAPLLLEDARVLARKGDWKGAASVAHRVRLDARTDFRQRIAAGTLEGYAMLQADPGSVEAAKIWDEALLLCHDHAAQATSMVLCNEFVLLTASRRWTSSMATKLLGGLVFQGGSSSAQSKFVSLFHGAEAFARVMNNNIDSVEGRALVRDYVLRGRSAQELTVEVMLQTLTAAACADGFSDTEHSAMQPLTRQIMKIVVEDFQRGRFHEMLDFVPFLAFWQTPPASPAAMLGFRVLSNRWSPKVRGGLCWLLAERCFMLGDDRTAAALFALAQAADLPPDIQARIQKQTPPLR